MTACKNLHKNLSTNTVNKTTLLAGHTVVKETSSWLFSVNAFYKKIETYSEALPDLAKPLQSSISQLIYSVTSLNDLTKEIIVKIEQGPGLKEVVTDLMVFPNGIPNKKSKEEYLNRFVSTKFLQLLNRNVVAGNDDIFAAELEGIQ